MRRRKHLIELGFLALDEEVRKLEETLIGLGLRKKKRKHDKKPRDIFRAIMAADKAGLGLRLSADEVSKLAADEAVRQVVFTEDEENEKE